MKKLLLPIILLIIGTGSGVGAAFLLKSPEDELALSSEYPCGDPSVGMAETKVAPKPEPIETTTEFAKFNNQFVVPVLDEDQVSAMVVLSLSIEVVEGNKDVIFQAEPKLRDAFLQVLFNHANLGGFSGNFTTATNMRILREELLRSSKTIVGENALDILILDIVRQDN